MIALGPSESGNVSGRWDPKSAYDQAASEYDDWPWQRVWREVERASIEQVLKLRKVRRVLDVGCGTGSLLRELSTRYQGSVELVGVDISGGMLDQARRKFFRGPVRFIHGDLLNCSFPRGHFDIVFMCRVASHLPNLAPYFAAISQALKPGGLFVLSDVHSVHTYECTRLPSGGHKIPVDTYKHAPEKIIAIAAESGIFSKESLTFDLKNLPNLLREDPDLPSSLREQIRSGISNPFGFLVVFEKNSDRPRLGSVDIYLM